MSCTLCVPIFIILGNVDEAILRQVEGIQKEVGITNCNYSNHQLMIITLDGDWLS